MLKKTHVVRNEVTILKARRECELSDMSLIPSKFQKNEDKCNLTNFTSESFKPLQGESKQQLKQ